VSRENERHAPEGEALVARFLLICLGGAIGTGARYTLSVWVARAVGTGFPFGTLVVNASGSFLLGLLMQLSLSTQIVSADARLIIGTGILGGFTTYSTFNYETLALIGEEAWGVALLNVAATFIACLAAGALGIGAARALAH
jgi:CrcB protein